MESTSTEVSLLFDEWENTFPEYKQKFIKDGIINEPLYQHARTKILFLQKEPNDPRQTAWDLTHLLNNYCSGIFSIRLSEWAYGILNDFPPLSTLMDYTALHEALKSTAVINLKKIGGSANSNMSQIVSHVVQNKSFLLKQIKLIDPQIIIGGVGQTRIWNLLFDDLVLSPCDYDIMVGRWNNIKIIDYYHPSYQVPRAMSYCLLQNVFHSKVFREL